MEATFSPADGVEATAEQLEAAKAIIELRMVSKSITDYEIYTDEANSRIIVRFPWKSGESDFDPEKAIEEISATALLTFREGQVHRDSDGRRRGQPGLPDTDGYNGGKHHSGRQRCNGGKAGHAGEFPTFRQL